MAKTIRVRATKVGFGGFPGARRRVGEVFNVPATRPEVVDGKKTGKEVPNTAGWYDVVPSDTPEGKVKPAPQKVALVKADGVVVPAVKAGISGGGGGLPVQPVQPAPAPGSGHDLV